MNDHDFPEKTTIKTVPYGIYDVAHNPGFVYVGTSGDTAAFAVDSIVRWFERQDRPRFKDERKLLILCDGLPRTHKSKSSQLPSNEDGLKLP